MMGTRNSAGLPPFFRREIFSGPMMVAGAAVVIALITTADVAGRRHISPGTSISFTVPREVAANVRALLLFGMSGLSLFVVSVIAMEFGLLLRWRTTALAAVIGVGLLEAIGPFFDLLQWLTAALYSTLIIGTLLVVTCESLQKREGRFKDWFSERYQIFVSKVDREKEERDRDLTPIGSLLLDTLLIVCCLAVLAYWGGEAHMMKVLHRW